MLDPKGGRPRCTLRHRRREMETSRAASWSGRTCATPSATWTA